MSTEYVCEHGIRGNHPFIHETGPTSTGNGTPPAPLCYPVPVNQEHETGGDDT